jgi:hypothetical protein
MLKSSAAADGAKAPRRYTEAEADRTGVNVKQGYQLIGALFGHELPSNNP